VRITRKQIRNLIKERFSSDDFRDVYHTAQMAHMGQKRRSGEDYFSHPSEVRNIVRKLYPQDKVSQLAALLHDSIEDAPGSTVSSAEEMEEFIRGSIGDPAAGEEVVRVVNALTHEKGGDYHSYVVSLIGDEPALRVKLADMVHNLSSSPSEKQRVKYQGALNALSIAAGGIPAGISGAHWDKLTKLAEGRKMRVTKKQLRRIIREALENTPGEFPEISHPTISQFADKTSGPMEGDSRSWFVASQSYRYKAGGSSDQGITVYLLPDGKYTARVFGSYSNTLSSDKQTGHHADAESAIEAALDSSPSGRPPTARELLIPVGEKVKPGGYSRQD